MSELFFKKGATVNLYDARYSLPPDTHEELTAIIDENNKIGDKARDEMEAIFIKAQEDMRRIIPELNMKSFRDDMTKRISTLEKRSTEAMKALAAGVSELDSLRAVMKLQSRVIAGESLDALLAKLTDPKELLALCDLAQQTNDSQLAQNANDKAVHIATNGAGKEIEQLQQAIRLIDREQAQYVERWKWLVNSLGLVR
jgi:uncharacterized protein YyaL (SSP411 family)